MNQRQQILALSGGGYRGLFAASILEELEARAGYPLKSRFNVLAGTSIGALLAAGIACGVPASKMAAAFRDHGEQIFDRSVWILGRKMPWKRAALGLVRSRYSPMGLEAVARKILGPAADAPIRDLAMPLLVVATNRQHRRAAIFRSWEGPAAEFAKATLLQAVMASAAAPTYFPDQRVCGSSLIDGGIIANAPDLIALIEWISFKGALIEECDILSLGTAGGVRRGSPQAQTGHGTLGSMLPTRLGGLDLFGVTLAAQQELTNEACAKLLGSRHVRIDVTPTEKEEAILGLDRTAPNAADLLDTLGKRALLQLRFDQQLVVSGMLRSEPKTTTV